MPCTMKLRWGCPALALLLGGLTAAAASAEPLSLLPFFSEPPKFAIQMFDVPQASLFSELTVSKASIPQIPASWSEPTLDSWNLSQSFRFTSPWMTLRQSDSSLRFGSWRQVLNVARLGKFVVPLRSDPGERTNIILAAQAIDNTTVVPGAVFSFNQIVGERTPDKGYQDGLMFSEGQLIRGTGGGICIVATGLYNAALHAGMGLLERHPHSGIVGYAPPGCDASIVYGSEDMQFQNTTDTPIVVKTDIKADCVVVSLYGQTPLPGHKVFVKTTRLSYIHAPIMEQPDKTLASDAKPVVMQKPRLGFDVTIERVIMQGAEVLQRETVVTEHRAPRPEIMRVPMPPVLIAPALSSSDALSNSNPAGRDRGQGAVLPIGLSPVPDAPHDIYWPFSFMKGGAANLDKGLPAQ